MGCGYEIACMTCKKHYILGYGSYSTWILVKTIYEFMHELKKDPELIYMNKNQNILRVLLEHEGHKLSYWNEDYCIYRSPHIFYQPPWGEESIYIENIDEYECIDLWNDDND